MLRERAVLTVARQLCEGVLAFVPEPLESERGFYARSGQRFFVRLRLPSECDENHEVLVRLLKPFVKI